MKLLFSTLFVAFLVGCSSSPKVVHVIDNEHYTATFTDAKCSDKDVLSIVDQSAKLAAMMGVPADAIKKYVDGQRQGSVHLKAKNEDRAFCYVDQGDGSAYVTDSNGGEGSVQFNSPKKP